jgi:hypothetical protein
MWRVTTNGIDPVDGLPAWTGHKVTPEWRKKREAKRAGRFVTVDWGELVLALHALEIGRAGRLLFVLYLYRNLTKAKATGGWVELVRHDLEAVGLADSNLTKAVAKLEALGLVEVQRRRGKRPLLRLVTDRA